MRRKLLFTLPVFLLVVVRCSESDKPKSKIQTDNKIIPMIHRKASNQRYIDTNQILNLISYYEYLNREQSTKIYIEELQQLKDSINYDSIKSNQVLPVFEKSK